MKLEIHAQTIIKHTQSNTLAMTGVTVILDAVGSQLNPGFVARCRALVATVQAIQMGKTPKGLGQHFAVASHHQYAEEYEQCVFWVLAQLYPLSAEIHTVQMQAKYWYALSTRFHTDRVAHANLALLLANLEGLGEAVPGGDTDVVFRLASPKDVETCFDDTRCFVEGACQRYSSIKTISAPGAKVV